MKNTETRQFLKRFNGGFTNMLRWPQFGTLWDALRQRADAGWYAYAMSEMPPDTSSQRLNWHRFSTKSIHYCAPNTQKIIAASFMSITPATRAW